jgi:hypothetical protein
MRRGTTGIVKKRKGSISNHHVAANVTSTFRHIEPILNCACPFKVALALAVHRFKPLVYPVSQTSTDRDYMSHEGGLSFDKFESQVLIGHTCSRSLYIRH